jgi:hypothetical protein
MLFNAIMTEPPPTPHPPPPTPRHPPPASIHMQTLILDRIFELAPSLNVVVSDVDVVWLRDPSPLFALHPRADLMAGTDEHGSWVAVPRGEGELEPDMEYWAALNTGGTRLAGCGRGMALPRGVLLPTPSQNVRPWTPHPPRTPQHPCDWALCVVANVEVPPTPTPHPPSHPPTPPPHPTPPHPTPPHPHPHPHPHRHVLDPRQRPHRGLRA